MSVRIRLDTPSEPPAPSPSVEAPERGLARVVTFGFTPLVAVILIGLATRVVSVAAIGPIREPDSPGYENLATNLATGQGFVDTREVGLADLAAIRTPVYPLFVAAVYRLGGMSNLVVIAAQQILGALTCGLILLIGTKTFGPQVGLLGGFTCAMHPWLAVYGNALMTETVFGFLLALTVLLVLVAVASPSPTRLFGAGAVLGLAVLCRPSALPLCILVPPLLAYQRRSLRRTFSRSASFFVGLALVVSPWVWRNYLYMGYPGVSPFVGVNLLWSAHVPGTRYHRSDPFERVLFDHCTQSPEHEFVAADAGRTMPALGVAKHVVVPCEFKAAGELRLKGFSTPAIDSAFLRIALRQIARDPLEYLQGVSRRTILLWSGYDVSWGRSDGPRLLRDLGQRRALWPAAKRLLFRLALPACLLILAVTGCVIAVCRKDHHVWFLLGVLLLHTLVHSALVPPDLRLRIPIEPYAILLASNGLIAVWHRRGCAAGETRQS